MISEETVKKYCNEDISKIENYDEAISDMNKTWDCHHRLEIGSDGERMSIQDLMKRGLYYNRPVEELIFLTHSEHLRLHMTGDRNPLYGKHHSKDARMKITKANIGRILSEETCMKMSQSHRGRKFSEEHKRKLSEALKRRPPTIYKGKHHSKESRMKISLAIKSYWEKKKMMTNE